MRVGWIIAPQCEAVDAESESGELTNPIRDKIVLAAEASVLCPSNSSQMMIQAYLENFDWLAGIKAFRKVYEERRNAMIESLEQFMPTCTWNVPTGGFYVWVKLPPGVDSKKMSTRAVENHHVAYVPGVGFYANGEGSEFMRLSFCYPTPDEIREGVIRLSLAIKDELDSVVE